MRPASVAWSGAVATKGVTHIVNPLPSRPAFAIPVRAAGNITNWVYENHWRAIGTGLALVVVWYALWEIMF